MSIEYENPLNKIKNPSNFKEVEEEIEEESENTEEY